MSLFLKLLIAKHENDLKSLSCHTSLGKGDHAGKSGGKGAGVLKTDLYLLDWVTGDENAKGKLTQYMIKKNHQEPYQEVPH